MRETLIFNSLIITTNVKRASESFLFVKVAVCLNPKVYPSWILLRYNVPTIHIGMLLGHFMLEQGR